jgi:D-alanyl-lipoteichoic acid acyltransferase DltB (MBOAT superfamily)
MLFNSLHFLLFFPVVTALFFALPHRLRWLHLLLASCYFYMAFIPAYLLILVFTIIVDYFAGLLIENSRGRRRKLALIASLIANVGVLAVFKYYNFFNGTFGEPLPILNIILPIGLSFHTFQAMSYTIEVYRGHEKAERHFGIYALYVMFYPQLVAGPIERPQNLLHQFHEHKYWDTARVFDGFKLMLWGFFLKIVIADRLALYVNPVYNEPELYHGLPVLLATYFFAFQIYCDFAGYSLIAIGAAQVMGFDLMENFRRPYFSKSIGEFWRRWHISLSTWFRDYLYIPLGGNRVPVPRWYFNLFFVFLVSGLWHGANWTFVVWGGLHGLYLVVGAMTSRRREGVWARVSDAYDLWQSSARGVAARGLALAGPRAGTIRKLVQVLITFHLVVFAWVFFRAASFEDAFTVLRNAFDFGGRPGGEVLVGLTAYELGLAVASILFMEAVHLLERKGDMRSFLSRKPAWVRYPVYAGLVLAILLFGEFGAQEFIYFQF